MPHQFPSTDTFISDDRYGCKDTGGPGAKCIGPTPEGNQSPRIGELGVARSCLEGGFAAKGHRPLKAGLLTLCHILPRLTYTTNPTRERAGKSAEFILIPGDHSQIFGAELSWVGGEIGLSVLIQYGHFLGRVNQCPMAGLLE